MKKFNLWNEDNSSHLDAAESNSQLLTQYKLYVEITDELAARRNSASTYFTTLHTLLLTAFGFAYEKGPALINRSVIWFAALGALTLCFAWWFVLRSYRQLSAGKYKIIAEMEKKLVCRPWSAEWEELEMGKNPKKYLPITYVENLVPFVFAGIYILFSLIVYHSV